MLGSAMNSVPELRRIPSEDGNKRDPVSTQAPGDCGSLGTNGSECVPSSAWWQVERTSPRGGHLSGALRDELEFIQRKGLPVCLPELVDRCEKSSFPYHTG